MMVHDLPTAILSSVDVGGAPLTAYRLTSNVALKPLGADRVSDIVGQRNYHYIVG